MLQDGFYNIDCMQAMREMPDNFIDLAIVDPPYGIGYDSQVKKKAARLDAEIRQVTFFDLLENSN